tara:strand:+ start:101 stop:409 length:309 start_codon:yes stop_codon:yes gene_type:complete
MDLSALHPYIDLLLDRGINSREEIDPYIHAAVFKLNLEQLNSSILVTNELTNCMVYNDNNDLVVEVRWLSDGAEFFVHRKKPSLLTVVAAVLTTINEIEESN